MALTYAITELPPIWPSTMTRYRKAAPFKTQWMRTLKLIERELRHLGARRVEMALELRSGSRDLRIDGMLRADARPGPAVILSFLDSEGQRQAYPCDTFAWWQDNLYAIAVVLEDLRRAERYGVQSALLRAGFKALPSVAAPSINAATAAHILEEFSGSRVPDILGDADVAKSAARTAIYRTHPDRNDGARAAYDRVDAARKVLSSHHGVSV